MGSSFPRRFIVEGAEKLVVARGVHQIKGCFDNGKKVYCLYANWNEPVQGEEKFTEQKKEGLIA